jgi:hypothetical protein
MRRAWTRLGTVLPALGLAGLVFVLAGCSRVEPPVHLLAEARGDQCVEPGDFMRREHMKILLTERDQAKRYGIRNPDYSIVGCVDCHVSPTATREDPSTHFCLACHQINAVRMDCFTCHTDRPSDAPRPGQRAAAPVDAIHAGLPAVVAEVAEVDGTAAAPLMETSAQ